MSKYWGYHLMLDCTSCKIESVTSEENIRTFLKELVPAIDMVAYGDPMIPHFATHDPDKAGFSVCQMIETSAITAHLVDKNGDMYLDIFSCKTFDIGVVQEIVQKYFEPTKMRVNFITRSAS